MTQPSALDLARASALAYEDVATVRAAYPLADVTLLDRDDSQAYVIQSRQDTLVAFRGTQVTENFSVTDIIRNAKIRPVTWRPGLIPGGRVHRGYKEGSEAIADDLADAMKQSKGPHYYTGHSLGGAEATLARTRAPYPQLTVTFGAPKVGDEEFVASYRHIPLVRYVHGHDIAPKHARPWLGYRHGGILVELNRSGGLVTRPWRWYDELIIPILAGVAVGAFDHRIGEYIAKLEGAEI